MSFYGMQMQSTLPQVIPGTIDAPDLNNRRLDFNSEIIDGGTIIIHSDGLFTISNSGNYFVSWFITLKTGLGDTGAYFSLIEDHYLATAPNTSISTEDYPSTCNMKTGQFSGSAIIQIEPDQICKLGLYNSSQYEATLATSVPVNANITIQPYVVGSYSSSYGLIGMTLTLDDSTSIDSALAYNAAIPFNLVKNSTPKIFSYDIATNTITISAGGNFLLHWSVNLDGSQDAAAISFSLISNSQIITTFDSTLLMQQAYSGFAFITATAGQTFQFVNTSKNAAGGGADLTMSNIASRAKLSIIGHS